MNAGVVETVVEVVGLEGDGNETEAERVVEVVVHGGVVGERVVGGSEVGVELEGLLEIGFDGGVVVVAVAKGEDGGVVPGEEAGGVKRHGLGVGLARSIEIVFAEVEDAFGLVSECVVGIGGEHGVEELAGVVGAVVGERGRRHGRRRRRRRSAA